MGVSLNGGIPKSSILIGCSIINHPFIWGELHPKMLENPSDNWQCIVESMSPSL